jgi:rubrerythrin
MVTTEQFELIQKIKDAEKEEQMLCDHQSWGAAEGVNARKCELIKRLMSTVTPEERNQIELIEAKGFLSYLAKGLEGAYPSSADAIQGVILPKFKCLRCGHNWLPRNENAPKYCPSCNSPYWNKERKNG